MGPLETLTSNPLLNICIISWFSAQVIKTLIELFCSRRLNPERLIGSGGMPSSHSAMVAALSIGMARVEGFESPMFAVTMALSAIVMYDAMNVRRATGENTKALNHMMSHYNNAMEFFQSVKQELDKHPLLDFEDDDEDEHEPNNDQPSKIISQALKEYRGHTPIEVLAGALLGILISMAYPF